MPIWLQILLAAQTLVLTIAGAVGWVLLRAFQAGSLTNRYEQRFARFEERLTQTESAIEQARPRFSHLTSRVQAMHTVEELRAVFASLSDLHRVENEFHRRALQLEADVRGLEDGRRNPNDRTRRGDA